MADSKLSAFPIATSVTAVDYLPILQDGSNKLATIGQVKTFNRSLSSISVVGAAVVPGTYDVVGVTGTCTLADATSPTRVLLVAEGVGEITFTPMGFSFNTGDTLELVWFAGVWNIIAIQGMTPLV